MNIELPVIAGAISTGIFALSTLPMLLKAFRTKDMRSYSLGSLLLSNVGNIIYSAYVFSLPAGPIWLLHSFYLFTTGLMLFWYLRYTEPRNPLRISGSKLSKAIFDPLRKLSAFNRCSRRLITSVCV
jgi:uncharacterized protein with PQ loop repeat